MPHTHLNNPDHWRDRGEEMRVLAESMSNESSRQSMFRLAADYDTLAGRAAMRMADEHGAPLALAIAEGAAC